MHPHTWMIIYRALALGDPGPCSQQSAGRDIQKLSVSLKVSEHCWKTGILSTHPSPCKSGHVGSHIKKSPCTGTWHTITSEYLRSGILRENRLFQQPLYIPSEKWLSTISQIASKTNALHKIIQVYKFISSIPSRRFEPHNLYLRSPVNNETNNMVLLMGRASN